MGSGLSTLTASVRSKEAVVEDVTLQVRPPLHKFNLEAIIHKELNLACRSGEQSQKINLASVTSEAKKSKHL